MGVQPSFGEQVKQRRRALGLTQAQLAQLVACSKELIKKVEANTRRPSIQIAERLAQYLQVPAAEQAAFLRAARPDLLLAPAPPAARAPGPTALFGRERDLAAVSQLLRAPEVGLVTLTGPGGIGKTRLALEVLAHLRAEFADGAAFVSLAAIRDPALVLPTVARALGVEELRDCALIESLVAWLRPRSLLLLLDNLEQVLAAAPSLSALCAGAPRLKLLATSRAALHIPGEHEWAVAPLALPNLQRQLPAAELLRAPAVALFVQRAQAVNPALVADGDNALTIARICERLDGLPLAIELAAARADILAPPAILSRLVGAYRAPPLDLLSVHAQDLPDRQQTIRSAIAWSYDLLDADQQTLFRRLGVFVGGGTPEAIGAVCGPLSGAGQANPAALHALLAGLVDQSLLRAVGGSDGQPRFVMLETLREYALERLAAAGELEALRRRHALYFLSLAEAAEPALASAGQQRWVLRLEAEHDNLRAALSWSYGEPAAEAGLRLAAALWQFWLIRGYVSEGRAWVAGMLARTGARAPSPALARALNGAGLLAWARNDFRQAQALLRESLALFVALDDRHGRAWVLNHLGQVALAHERFAEAAALIEESLALFRAEGSAWNAGWALMNLGHAVRGLGDERQALAHYSESLALFREIGDVRGIAWSLDHLGHIARVQGDYRRAGELLDESLRLFREMSDAEGTAWILEQLGRLAAAQGDWRRAASRFGESLALARDLGHQWWMAWGMVGLASAANLRGQPERAAQLLGAAEGIFRSFDEPTDHLNRAYYEQVVAAVGDRLPPSLFVAARAAGQGLSCAQAVAYALEECAAVAV